MDRRDLYAMVEDRKVAEIRVLGRPFPGDGEGFMVVVDYAFVAVAVPRTLGRGDWIGLVW